MTHSEKPLFDAIVLHEDDSVATVLRDVFAGEKMRVKGGNTRKNLEICEDVPLCHKVAIKVIEAGEPVLKSGQIIGVATTRITSGSHVHVHNLVGRDPADCL